MIECMEEEVEKQKKKRITKKNISQDELQYYAMKHRCFTRDMENDIVYCPKGQILKHKSRHRDGIKYCTKSACSKCIRPCTKAKFKEVVFHEGQVILKRKKKKAKNVQVKC